MMKYRYYRSLLRSREQEAYDQFVKGLESCEEKITLPALKEKEIDRVFTAVKLDQTHLFYVDFRHYSFTSWDDRVVLTPDYYLKGEDKDHALRMIEQAAQDVIDQMNRAKPDDPFLFLHDWLVMNSVYGEVEGREYDAHQIYGALIDHKCVCEGFAKAYRYLCTLGSLQCIVVFGKASGNQHSGGHAWNIIRDHGRDFHVDVTFDLLIDERFCSRSYYKVSERMILKNHSIDSIFCVPASRYDGSVIKTVRGTRQLIQFMKEECYRGSQISQVRLSRGFRADEIIEKIRSAITPDDYAWYNRLDKYYYNDGSTIISFIWEQPAFNGNS